MEKTNEKEKEFRSGDSGPKYLVRGPYWEGGIILFKPGQKLGAHYHREVEETFYFLSGSGKIIINNVEYNIQSGDVYKIAPTEIHDIINDTCDNLRGIFIKCPYKPDDKINV
jgi:mannose-6-phosphate isomerase-like protein (cupin superfamily)